MGERVCCYDYRRNLAACFRRQDVCGEKIKNRRTEEKKTTVLRYLLFRQNFYAVICDKYHVFDLG